jgi:beta-lactamase regulating signal transducer with metallopeptidase domain
MTVMFLLEMAWKSSALILGTMAVMVLLKGRSPADRLFVLRLSVGLLLVLPLIAMLGPDLRVEQPALPPSWHPLPLSEVQAVAEPQAKTVGGRATGAAAPARETGPLLAGLVVAVYGAGVGAVLSHLAAGLLTLRRWTQGARPVWHPLWAAAYDRARLRSGVRREVPLLTSADIPETMGWGLRRPVILIDRQTLARDEQAEAVMGHEMAHVAHGDWLALLLGRLMLALFWFNPLAWILNRRMLEEAEAAADMTAVAPLDPAYYAQTLLHHALRPTLHAVPATAMAGSSGLGRRIRAVLDDTARSRRSGSPWTALACSAVLASGVAIAAVELLPARPARAAAAVTSRPSAAPEAGTALPAAPADDAAAMADRWTDDPVLAEVPAEGDVQEVPDIPQPPEPPSPPVPPVPAAPPAPPSPPAPPVPDHGDAGEWALGVTDQWKADMAAALAVPAIDREDAMALKALGVTPARARELRAAGVQEMGPDCLMELAAMGVTPGFVRDMAAAGFSGLPSDALVELKAVGVTAAFAERARKAGQARTVDELVELRVLGRAF